MATYLFVSSLQPTVSARIAAEAVDPIDLCVTSPSEDAHATASAECSRAAALAMSASGAEIAPSAT